MEVLVQLLDQAQVAVVHLQEVRVAEVPEVDTAVVVLSDPVVSVVKAAVGRSRLDRNLPGL